jgi:hypothetical protein
MPVPERRQLPRTAIDRLAYIHIEPDNGGIVLNLSGEGLCFHSFAPVERNGSFRFSLLGQNRRISVSGELAWTDEIQKIGGVRFTTLTTEARQQVETWISQPVNPGEERKSPTLGAALLKAVPGLRVHRLPQEAGFDLSSVDGISSKLKEAAARLFLKTKARLKLSGFSAGLATGLIVSALCAFMFLLYAHRRDVGEALIHLGERLATKPEISGQVAQAAPPAAIPSRQGITSAEPSVPATSEVRAQAPARSQAPARKPEFLEHPETATGAPKSIPDQSHRLSPKPQPGAIQPPATAPVTRAATPSSDSPRTGMVQRSAAHNSADSAPPATVAALTSPALPVVNVAPTGPATRAPEPPGAVSVRSSADDGPFSPAQMYFDLGKFKDELWAHNLGDKLAQLGLHASVIQRGHLWMNSYQVLVGPYGNQEQATKIHQELLARGYKPHAFERGSRDFLFGSPMTLNSAKLPAGDFTISWESYVTDAKVKFAQGNTIIATADGRWVTQPSRYEHNEFVYVKGANGSRDLVEVHFSGLDRALVLR